MIEDHDLQISLVEGTKTEVGVIISTYTSLNDSPLLQYADVMVNGTIREYIPFSWMRVIDETG